LARRRRRWSPSSTLRRSTGGRAIRVEGAACRCQHRSLRLPGQARMAVGVQQAALRMTAATDPLQANPGLSEA
jgi:hypothetical protein